MKLKILLAGIMGALMLFSLLAVADYSDDQPLTEYASGSTYGDLVYVTVEGESGYLTLNADGSNTMSQDLTLTIDDIPEGATIKTARLYNYITWSTSDNRATYTPGDPAEATLTFNGATVTCQNPMDTMIPNPIDYDNGVVQYWDTKGQGYDDDVYDYPSGTFAWDVTDLVTGSDTYTATITNADSSRTTGESITTYGFGLLVVYDMVPETRPSPKKVYWIMEGCDILWGNGEFETPEDATTTALFDGIVPKYSKLADADLTTVVVSSNTEDSNSISFNNENIGYSSGISDKAIGVDEFDVTSLLQKSGNLLEIQDSGDYMVPSNAFLVVTV